MDCSVCKIAASCQLSDGDLEYPLVLTLDEVARGGEKQLHPETSGPFTLVIPPGLPDGLRLRLRGLGRPRPSSPAAQPTGPQGSEPGAEAASTSSRGDLYLLVMVCEHPYFHRNGRDLVLEMPVEASTARQGGSLQVPRLPVGQSVVLELPPGAATGSMYRLPGQGMPIFGDKTGACGDLLVEIELYTPGQAPPALARRLQLIRSALGAVTS